MLQILAPYVEELPRRYVLKQQIVAVSIAINFIETMMSPY